MRAVVWSREGDHYWGPFTYANEGRKYDYRVFGIVLTSGKGDDDDSFGNGCYLRLHLLGHTLIVALPQIIKPYRIKVYARSWDAATVERLGRDWYWDVYARDYGFCFTGGALHYDYGEQTHSSDTDKSGCWFLPWLGTRHIRHSFYDLDGEHWVTLPEDTFRWNRKTRTGKGVRNSWDAKNALEAACPTVKFDFKDFDGEAIVATTRIEEREWAHGTGWFRWLSLFRRNKVRRSLDLSFSSEVGKRKGSWKGGTVGTGIDMLSGELHVDAFCRWCEQNRATFVGVTQEQAVAL